MKQFFKRILSVFLAIIMLIPMGLVGIEASAASKTLDEALAWVRSQNGKSLDVDGYPASQPYQCVDFIAKYYEYLGVSRSSGNGCDYATNTLPSNWSRVKGGSPQPGDILVYTGNDSNHKAGHVAIYEASNAIWHQNWGYSYVIKTTNKSYNSLSSYLTYWGCIRPNFNSGGSSSSVKFTTNIDNAPTDWQTFDKAKTSNFNIAGWAFRNTNELTRVYYCFDDNGYTQLNPVNRQDVVNTYGNTQLDCGFNQNIDISGLSVGDHTFKIWCSSNGIDHDMYYIGIHITSSDTQGPTISNIAVKNSPTGYLITCSLSDNIGVNRVRFPTWTSSNGQDDLVWHEGNINPDGKSAWCQINNSEHNNEVGIYYTDIYAYDSNNKTAYRTVEAYVGDMIKFHNISNTSNGSLGIDVSGTPILSGQVKYWFVEYDMDTNYYIDILIDGKKVISNSSSDSNGYISYVVDTTTMNNGAHTITANLYDSQAKYTISKNFVVNNASCTVELQPFSESGVSTKTVVVGGTYGNLPTPTRNGWVFDGWYTAATGGTKVTSSTKVTATSNHALYAHWKTQTVYFSNNDGVTLENLFRPCWPSSACKFDVGTQTITINGTINDNSIIGFIPFEPSAGEIYKVTATVVGGSMGSGYFVIEGCDSGIINMSDSKYGGVRMNIDIKNSTSATWKITEKQAVGLSMLKVWVWAKDGNSVVFNNYKLQVKIEKLSSVSSAATAYTPAAQYIKNGSTYGTLPTPTRNGYTFDGWYTASTGGTKITSSTKVTATSNHTLYAHWTCQHSSTEIRNAKAATCTTTGYTGDTYCKTCGIKTKTGTTISKTEHIYTAVVTKQPTCTNKGIKTFTCSCGASYTEDIAMLDHVYESVTTSPACTEKGYTTYTCSCGDTYIDNYVEAVGHSYKSAVTVEPTCTDVGIKTFTCSCGDSYTEEIEKLNHEYETVVTAPTCTEQGYTTYTCECGDTYVADYVNETGHSHSSEITTSATHLKEGVMTFACECGDTYTEPVAKLPDHTYETVVTAPTCTEQGFTTYTCECGDSYADDYVEAKGHTDELIPGYAATCTETGLTDGVKCSVCGTVTAEQKTIPVVAHNDSNNDGICDNCDFDATKNCSHTCHSDNAFIQFFWKIINFLQKLFGVKSARYCDCGVDHW